MSKIRKWASASSHLFVVGSEKEKQTGSTAASLGDRPVMKRVLDSLADGILVCNSLGTISYYNQRLIEYWNVPKALLKRGDAFKVLNHLIRSLDDADWQKRSLPESSSFESCTLVETKDGRLCELHSLPLGQNGATDERLWRFTDVTEKKNAYFAATHDPVTSLPNLELFLEAVNFSMVQNQRIAVVSLNIDRFHMIYSGLGHDEGNALLSQVALRIRSCLRPGDVVSRLGGDQFGILMHIAENPDEITAVLECIRRSLAEPFPLNERAILITVGFGIAFRSVHHSPQDLIHDAQTALLRAKSSGRSGSEIYEPTMRTRAVRVLELEAGLGRAIERKEFRVHYQPILSAKTGKAEAFEALVRWYHPEKGVVPPAEFIPIVEETGLIVPLGELVLRESARQLRDWQNQFKRRFGMSVNISPKQFENGDLNAKIRSVIAEFELSPGSLMLEITEGTLIKDFDSALHILTCLKGQNVRLLLDDFGTGHSSLNYLNRFPFDTLKIDRSFVDGIEFSQEKKQVMKAIVTLARNLKMDVIAEGVETEEQSNVAKGLRCRWLQGFLFGKPAPAADLQVLLQNHAL